MFKQIALFLMLTVPCAQAMDTPPEDVFSRQPNVVRKLIIFPLLQSSTSVYKARKILYSVALISKKSYEQVICPFFMRDVLQIIGGKHKDPDAVIACQLNMSGALKYNKMSEKLYQLVTERSGLDHDARAEISYWVDEGISLNGRYGISRSTLAMHAVQQNCGVDFIRFLINKGADVDVRSSDGYYARDCNIIYSVRALKKLIEPMLGKMWKVETKNRQNSGERMSVSACLMSMPEARALENALAVDKILQDRGAVCLTQSKWHPLPMLIKESRIIRRLFLYLYRNDLYLYRNKMIDLTVLPDNIALCLEKYDPFQL